MNTMMRPIRSSILLLLVALSRNRAGALYVSYEDGASYELGER